MSTNCQCDIRMNIALIVGVSIAASSVVIGLFILLTYLVIHTRRARRRRRLGNPMTSFVTDEQQQQQPPTSTTHLPVTPRTEKPREVDRGLPPPVRRENKLRRPPRARRNKGPFYELGRMRRAAPPPPPLSLPPLVATKETEAESTTSRPRSSRGQGAVRTPGGDRAFSPVPSFISPGEEDDGVGRRRRRQSGDNDAAGQDAGPPSPQPSSDLGHGRSPRSLDLFSVNAPEPASSARPLETLYVPPVVPESPMRSVGFARRASRGIMVEREEAKSTELFASICPRIPDELLAALESTQPVVVVGLPRRQTTLYDSQTPSKRRI
ncbi:SubName: Full=Uncharacterized protein {ECO:0000313/EMBL:CCA70971.1} [Serendipita indica DSM 11827]|nr:SubName: Full=Uncharacterized protein {ECO:0000313/EMBL:CCA70971.1} [Serendipita indica DSM 11827]